MTKAELCRYSDLKKEKEDLKERIIRLDSAMKSAGVQVITGMPRASSSDPDKLGRNAAEKERLLKLYQKKLQEIDAECEKIEKEIEQLEPIERRLVRHRYIDCMTWEKVCVKIGYSWANTHRLHARILRKLENIKS